MDSQMQSRADRLARNPLNISGIAGCPPMTLHNFTAARFEREGMRARSGAACPYSPGTMAATRWHAGYNAAHSEPVT